MGRLIARVSLVLAVCGMPAPAVNGKAVSIAWRYSDLNWGEFNPKCPENNMYAWAERGSVVRFTIAGASVTCGTIFSRANGFAIYPALNVAGTQVAFFRYGYSLGKSPTSGKDTLLNQGQPSHVSVVNIDGSNFRDLCQLPAAPGNETALDWPAGNWIYYVRPKSGSGGGSLDI
jgi:hypothetical protein